jgi:peptidoglycan/LPS O-acetylase OafA/YrhL
VQRALTNRFLVYTGTISYGLYLLHKIPFDMGKTLHMDRHPMLSLPTLLVACYVLAALSWNLLEKPFLRLKPSSDTERARPDAAEPQLSLTLQQAAP